MRNRRLPADLWALAALETDPYHPIAELMRAARPVPQKLFRNQPQSPPLRRKVKPRRHEPQLRNQSMSCERAGRGKRCRIAHER
jgi:hypothetical protein